MIKVSKVQENVIIVTQTVYSFTSTDVTHVLIDIHNWLKSQVFTDLTKPNDITVQMTDSDIQWVKKYYIPKVQ